MAKLQKCQKGKAIEFINCLKNKQQSAVNLIEQPITPSIQNPNP